MKKHPYRLWISLILLASVSAACNLAPGNNASEPTAASTSTPVAAGPTSSATPTQKVAAAATPTATSSPTRAATKAVSASATPTQQPQCSTRVNLKIRKGPGTAYDPPLTAVEANTKLIPSGYNPQGIPGGSWVLVSALDNSFSGWASASADFLTCNIDLTTLPPVEVAPPPPTPTLIKVSAPKVSNNGGFGDCPLNLTCDDSFSAETLSAVNAHFTDSDTNGDGVANVVFEIWDSNESVKFYSRQENNPVYCTFGGDGPCNSWTFENGAFRWTPGGAAVEPGDYVVVMTINGTTADENGNSQGQLRHFFRVEAP